MCIRDRPEARPANMSIISTLSISTRETPDTALSPTVELSLIHIYLRYGLSHGVFAKHVFRFPLFCNDFTEYAITVKIVGRKSGDLLYGFADAYAESGEYSTDLILRIRAVSGNYKRSKAMHNKPHISEVAIRLLDVYKRQL